MIKMLSVGTPMKIAMDKLCRIFSRALDIIEKEQIGASDFHSMRISALCALMGKKLGYDDDAISALATCALFHDNALTEYHLSMEEIEKNGRNMALHCEKGQSNVSWLPFKTNIDGFILYHHERGNGKGPFHKHEGEYPFEAALIAVADAVDVVFKLQHVTAAELPGICEKIAGRADAYSTRPAVDVLLDILDEEVLESLRDENISETLDKLLPCWEIDLDESAVMGIAGFMSHIIDYKSKFTRKHSSQIANRAWLMANYYGYNEKERAALYLAASLHDIGKIATPTEVLEKPGKLDKEEFEIIKEHVLNTHVWLSEMPDFDPLLSWAAGHHEKLDGTGYSFGRLGEDMDFNTRLMAIIDIYQAVCELRPYHDARSHEDTMPILYRMAENGFIDKGIVKDIDKAMAEYSLQDIPPPL